MGFWDRYTRRISNNGLRFIAEFEGLPNEGRPYNDPVGYATVGYGHLLGYRPVQPRDRRAKWVKHQKRPGQLTKKEARRLLRKDLGNKYEPAVRALFKRGGPLHGKFRQERYDALVSFAYNLGAGSLTGTPGFETIGRAVKAGQIKAIGDAMLLYSYAGGILLPGLYRRRQRERRLFLLGRYEA